MRPQLEPAITDQPSITQIAEGLAGARSPSEIVKAIIEQRPSLELAELAGLLDRAKELQAHAEKLQRKAAILMEVVEEIVKLASTLVFD